jgi:beta-glucosidase-like glycosyl hydrolase
MASVTRTGRLLFPALRWKSDTGFGHETETIDRALALGVGGFCLFGGEVAAVRELTAELRSRSDHAMLISADLERGAGQQFKGAVQLPPLAALGVVDDREVTERAARLTAREALALGVNWIYAPVADVDLEPRNPIVGTRAVGTDAARVAKHVTAWIRGCRAEGVLCCAKHFPGHGRTTDDSHAVLPRVDTARSELEAVDLLPFRAAALAGVDAIMTAHVCYPSLDSDDVPATLSRRILTDLLRTQLGFEGIIVTDALIMEGVLRGGTGEEAAAVRALSAGCDALLYPNDLVTTAAAIERAAGDAVPEARIADAIARIAEAADRAPTFRDAPVGMSSDRAWAVELGARAVTEIRGTPSIATAIDVVTVDDDVGGPYPPPAREAFPRALRSAGFDARATSVATDGRGLVITVYCDIRAWKGRPGLSVSARGSVERLIEARPDACIVLFGHPRLAEETPGANVIAAWGGEEVMQRAAARRLRELGGA